MFFPVRYIGIGGQVSIMIQKKVKLNGPFGTPELRPREQRQTEGYGGAIQGEQFVLESEFVLSWGCALTHSEGLVEKISKHLPGSMGIGIGEGGLAGRILHPQMSELPQAAG
jgi:hypothetical protein